MPYWFAFFLPSFTLPTFPYQMDVEMPVMDGLSAVREIRHLESTGQLPRRHRVYALTGNAREGQVSDLLGFRFSA